MSVIGLPRRFAIALVSLAIAGVLFRSHLAAALITRGDDALRTGDSTAAVRYYRRALALDASSSRAADRLAFHLALRRGPGDAQAAVEVASTALTRLPDDPALLADRGLAEQLLQRWKAAEADFGRAGAAGRDARYDHLAGRVALRLGDVDGARRYFRSALAHEPRFAPARAALEHLR